MDSNMPAQPKQSLMIGSVFIVLAFLANTIQSVFGKAIESEVSVEMFSWVTFLSALVVVTIIVALRRFRDLKTKVLPMHLLRGGTGISGFLLFTHGVVSPLNYHQLPMLYIWNITVSFDYRVFILQRESHPEKDRIVVLLVE
jgi:EamA domain-containing membrane protein RarD